MAARLKIGDNTRRPSGHRLNAAHLQNPEFRDRIAALWAERGEVARDRGWDAEKLFLSCMQGTRTVDRCWGKCRAAERKAREVALQSRLSRAQAALEGAPASISLQLEVQEVVALLSSFDKEKAEWVDTILQERWLKDGDRGTKLFFKNFKNMSSAKQIPALLAEDGNRTTTWDGMAEVAVDFF